MTIGIVRETRPMIRDLDRQIAAEILGYRMVKVGRHYELQDREGLPVGTFASAIYYNTEDEETCWSIYCPHFSGAGEKPGTHAGDGNLLVATLALEGWQFQVARYGSGWIVSVAAPGKTAYTATG